MMRKFIVLLFLAIVAGPAMLQAGIHGVLKGKVLDEEGKGVMGASIRVEGTTRGAFVKSKDGSYLVSNIVAGEYTVKYSSVGKPVVTKVVRISADDITEMDVTLKEQDVKFGVIQVTGDKLSVDKNSIGTIDKLSGKQLTNAAREGLMSVIGLSAGVRGTGNGFNIRGSRTADTQIRVDGYDVGNQFQGGLGGTSSRYFPMVSASATEEVQVLTGGFSAEYGEAQGGIVNSVVKSGRTDRYEGFMRYRTDLPSLYGSQESGVELIREGVNYKPISAGPGAKKAGANENNYEFGFGGPLPMLGKSTFYLTGRFFNEANRGASYDIKDPLGNNVGAPAQASTVKNLTGKFKFDVIENLSLIVGGQYGITTLEGNSLYWAYSKDQGIIDGKLNGIPEGVAKQNVTNQMMTQAYAKINHSLNSNSFYEISLSNSSNNDESARRKTFGDPNFFTGYDLLLPEDKYIVKPGGKLELGDVQNGRIYGDKMVDIYQQLSKIGTTKDGYLPADIPIINPLTGYYEGAVNNTGLNNPWGGQGLTANHGNGSGFQFRYGNYWQIEGSYSNSFGTGDFSHMFKTGFDFRFFDQQRQYNGMPWDGNPFYDVYTSKYGGNIYADDPKVFAKTSQGHTPSKYGVFVQDQIAYKGMIISPGIRFDVFNPNSMYRTGTKFVSINQDSGFADASTKFQISPRLNVSYPLTDNTKFSLSYGIYYKTPEMQYMFDNFAMDKLRGNDILGNPNVEAQRTNSYAFGLSQGISEFIKLEVTAYYKDIYNQLGITYFPDIPTPYNQYVVSEYGNAKGIEVDLRKNPTLDDHIGLRVNYTYASVIGTASDATANANPQIDPYTNVSMFPQSPYPMDNDVRHVANASIDFVWDDNQGPSIYDIQLLENMNINLTASFQSGSPYTKSSINGKPLSDINSERSPTYWRIDSRISKSFNFKDWFGEKAGYSSIQFFADINNVLNRQAIIGYFIATGDALNDGTSLNKFRGDFSAVPFYKDATGDIADSYKADQYDVYGERFYSAAGDFDKNGIVTQAEKLQSYVNYQKLRIAFKSNFMTPITVSAGFMINF